jgi:hypothetical protein
MTTDDWGDDGTQASGQGAGASGSKSDRAKGAGRYKCRYCGGIKRQHVCPALIDIPRASTGTQADLALTMGHGAYHVLPCVCGFWGWGGGGGREWVCAMVRFEIDRLMEEGGGKERDGPASAVDPSPTNRLPIDHQTHQTTTKQTGGMPVIPVELHGCRFLTVRRPSAHAHSVSYAPPNGADGSAPPVFHQASMGSSAGSLHLGSSMGSLTMGIPIVVGGPAPVVLAPAGGPPDGVYYQQQPAVVQYPPPVAPDGGGYGGGVVPQHQPQPQQQQQSQQQQAGYKDYQAL